MREQESSARTDGERVRRESVEKLDVEIEVEKKHLLYKISDAPPIYLTIFFALQQCLISIPGSIVLPLLIAEAVCALEHGMLIRKLVSSTLFLSGVTTMMQVLVGIRLPVYQGPSGSYTVPIIALNKMDPARCDASLFFADDLNSTSWHANATETELQDALVDIRVRELMWPLVIAGFIHFLVGVTGLIGLLLRFIGPITIVPTILLIGLYIVKPAQKFMKAHWGITALTWSVGLILSLYLARWPMPIPVWTRKKGFRIIRYPLHQVFAILISIMVGWSTCGIMTYAGVFPEDKSDVMYMARTDARASVIRDSGWFYFPYPGQFGSPLFSVSTIVGFMMATVTSILDSIGDYYATAAICRIPAPPSHGVNRGIAVEGFCSMISGFFGVGHATSTYGGNIGAIGMTRVASRHVFIAMATIYLCLAILAKVAAAFVSIPYPVLGGVIITTIGVFVGVNLSNLRVVDLSSTRNLSIMGMSVFVGLLVPTWMEENASAIRTGTPLLNQILKMLLGNPNFVGAFLACFLDNTVPGSLEERGITAWQKPDRSENAGDYSEGIEVYDLPMPACLKRRSCLRHIPILPKYETNNLTCSIKPVEARTRNGCV